MTAPAENDLWDNPLGTDGFEFVEYCSPEPEALGNCSNRWVLRVPRGTGPRT